MAEFFVAMSKGRLNLTQQHKIGNQLKYAKLEWHGSQQPLDCNMVTYWECPAGHPNISEIK